MADPFNAMQTLAAAAPRRSDPLAAMATLAAAPHLDTWLRGRAAQVAQRNALRWQQQGGTEYDESVADFDNEFRRTFPALDPAAYRDQYMGLRNRSFGETLLQQELERQRGQGADLESLGAYATERILPLAGGFFAAGNDIQYAGAARRIEEGRPRPDDFRVVASRMAEQERMAAVDQWDLGTGQPLYLGTIADSVAQSLQLGAEFMLAGNAAQLAGRAAAGRAVTAGVAGLARQVGPRAAAQMANTRAFQTAQAVLTRTAGVGAEGGLVYLARTADRTAQLAVPRVRFVEGDAGPRIVTEDGLPLARAVPSAVAQTLIGTAAERSGDRLTQFLGLPRWGQNALGRQYGISGIFGEYLEERAQEYGNLLAGTALPGMEDRGALQTVFAQGRAALTGEELPESQSWANFLHQQYVELATLGVLSGGFSLMNYIEERRGQAQRPPLPARDTDEWVSGRLQLQLGLAAAGNRGPEAVRRFLAEVGEDTLAHFDIDPAALRQDEAAAGRGFTLVGDPVLSEGPTRPAPAPPLQIGYQPSVQPSVQRVQPGVQPENVEQPSQEPVPQPAPAAEPGPTVTPLQSEQPVEPAPEPTVTGLQSPGQAPAPRVRIGQTPSEPTLPPAWQDRRAPAAREVPPGQPDWRDTGTQFAGGNTFVGKDGRTYQVVREDRSDGIALFAMHDGEIAGGAFFNQTPSGRTVVGDSQITFTEEDHERNGLVRPLYDYYARTVGAFTSPTPDAQVEETRALWRSNRQSRVRIGRRGSTMERMLARGRQQAGGGQARGGTVVAPRQARTAEEIDQIAERADAAGEAAEQALAAFSPTIPAAEAGLTAEEEFAWDLFRVEGLSTREIADRSRQAEGVPSRTHETWRKRLMSAAAKMGWQGQGMAELERASQAEYAGARAARGDDPGLAEMTQAEGSQMQREKQSLLEKWAIRIVSLQEKAMQEGRDPAEYLDEHLPQWRLNDPAEIKAEMRRILEEEKLAKQAEAKTQAQEDQSHAKLKSQQQRSGRARDSADNRREGIRRSSEAAADGTAGSAAAGEAAGGVPDVAEPAGAGEAARAEPEPEPARPVTEEAVEQPAPKPKADPEEVKRRRREVALANLQKAEQAKAERAQQTVLGVLRSYGGLSARSVEAHGHNLKEFKEEVPGAIVRGRKGLEMVEAAERLIDDGVLSVPPEGVELDEHLYSELVRGAMSQKFLANQDMAEEERQYMEERMAEEREQAERTPGDAAEPDLATLQQRLTEFAGRLAEDNPTANQGLVDRLRGIAQDAKTEARWNRNKGNISPDTLAMMRSEFLPSGHPMQAELEAFLDEIAYLAGHTGDTEVAPGVFFRRGAPVPAIPAADAIERVSRAIGNWHVIETLGDLFRVPIIHWRLARGVQGYYDARPRGVVINNRYAGEIVVYIHEIAHHVDTTTDVLANLTPDELRELQDLDYDQKLRRPAEGFAEFLVDWMTGRGLGAAPAFAARFARWAETAPVRDAVFAGRAAVDAWRSQTPLAQAMGQMNFDGTPARPLNRTLWDNLKASLAAAWNAGYAAMKEEGHFLALFERDARRNGYNPKKGESFLDLFLAMTGTAPSYANKAVTEGVFSLKDFNKIGPSLYEALAGVGKDRETMANFSLFLAARHALEVYEINDEKGTTVNPGLTREQAQAVVDEFQTPAWEAAARRFTAFNNALLEMLVESGVLTEAQYRQWVDKYKTYVPLKRVQKSSWWRGGPAPAQQLINLRGPIKTRLGSNAQIIDPVQSAMRNAVAYYQRAVQQEVVAEMIRAYETTPGLAGWMQRVPVPTKKVVEFSLQEILPQLEKAGIDPAALEEAELGTMAAIYRPDYDYTGGKPVGRVERDGRTELYYITEPELFKAISGMQVYHLPWFLNSTFGAAARMVRLGRTGLSAAFALPNMVRDYGTYFFQRKYATGPRSLAKPLEWAGTFAMAKVLGRENEIIALWEQMAGPLSREMGLDQARVEKATRRAFAGEAEGFGRVVEWGKDPINTLREMIGFSEVGPRLAEFEAALAAQGWDLQRIRREGRPPRHVLVEAVNAANDVTTNFRRMGWLGKQINAVVPFFNAGLEGLDKFARTVDDMRKTPAGRRKLLIRTGVSIAGTLAYWWLKKDEDWYRNAPPWLKFNYVVLTDLDGTPMLRVPRTHNWNWFVSAGVEATADAIYRQDPGVFADIGEEMRDGVAPNAFPALITPMFEAYQNWSYFRDDYLYNPRMADYREPRDQANPWNTQLMRAIGDAINVSPARMEHLVDELTGGLYTGVVGTAERTMQTAGLAAGPGFTAEGLLGPDGPLARLRFRSDYAATPNLLREEVGRVQQQYGSARARGEVPQALAVRYRTLNSLNALMGDLRELNAGVQGRAGRFDVERYVVGLADFALGRPELDRYPNPLRDPAAPPAVQALTRDYLTRMQEFVQRGRPQRQAGETQDEYAGRVDRWEADRAWRVQLLDRLQ